MRHSGELISAYLDGELRGDDLRSLFQHLGECGRCSDELIEIQEVRGAVRSLPVMEVPADLVPGYGEVIPLHRNRGFWASAAAAVVIVVIAIAALVTPPATTISADDLNSHFAARVSLDPAFGPAKVILPDITEIPE
ncbi:MAG: anti-sigma factor [Acidimicrobiia bacterium]